ncbi:restriction endonuclease subunit S [Campylobacter gastrosuis]|uniref:restriction endonuclease subunit S n=1 Tax=Campylobacter gastrosuis TaxID=2974576 RepID=UPI003D770B46
MIIDFWKIERVEFDFNEYEDFIDIKWQKYKVSDLFNISGSKTTPKAKLELIGKGKFPYITTQAINNGIAGYYNFFTELGDCLTIDSAVLGTCFYQKENFSASDHVEILRPKFKMNEKLAFYFCSILNKNIKILNYAYNKKRSQTAIKNEIVFLPTKNNQIDFDFMEKYIYKIQKRTQKLIYINKKSNIITI